MNNDMDKHIFSTIHTYTSTNANASTNAQKNSYIRIVDGAPIKEIRDWDGVPVAKVEPSYHTIKSDCIILYAHGNKWDLGRLLERPFRPTRHTTLPQSSSSSSLLEIIAKGAHLPVIAFEYPGFGADDKKNVSITGAVDAMLHVYSKLNDYRRVIVFGYSMGTGVTAEMVRKLHEDPKYATLPKPAGMVLQSAFESVLRTSEKDMIKKIMMRTLRFGGYDAYPTHKFISKLTGVPLVAFIHGGNDKRTPIDGAKRMAEQVASNGVLNQKVMTYWDVHADHNDLPLRKRFCAFLEKISNYVLSVM